MSYWTRDYKSLRDGTWPFQHNIWGRESNDVITYLRIIYMEHNKTKYVDNDQCNVKNEAEIILDWWWQKRYDQMDTCEISSYPDEFGKWLLGQYQQKIRLNPIDNRPTPPRAE